jgi:hypothetical protein
MYELRKPAAGFYPQLGKFSAKRNCKNEAKMREKVTAGSEKPCFQVKITLKKEP